MNESLCFRGFAALDDAGVSWSLLRGEAELPTPTGDVDLLVDPRHADLAASALQSCGFVRQRSWAGGSQQFFLGRDETTGAFVLIHMTTVVAFGDRYGLELPVAGGVLARSERPGGVRVVSRADEFWLSLLHCLLDKGGITPKHRSRLPELITSATPHDEIVSAMAEHCPDSWDASGLLADIRNHRWDVVEATAAPIRKEWTRRMPRVRLLVARHTMSLWARKLVEPILARGTSCALLAPDGAGKSTVADRLGAALPRPVKVIYLGAYGAGTRGSSLPVPGVDALVRMGTLWARWLIGSWHQNRRRFVIYDRHPIELLVGAGGSARTGLRRRALAALPRPDVLIILDAPGEVLYRRKGEHDVETLEAMRQRYLRLADLVPGTVVIDADRPTDEVRLDVANAIWSHRVRRG